MRFPLSVQLGVSVLVLAGCASVEPFSLPEGDGAGGTTMSAAGMPSQGGGGAAGEPAGGNGGQSEGTGGDTGSGGDSQDTGGTSSGGMSAAGSGGAAGGGAAGSGTCYMSGCPGCILTSSSLLGAPCCTSDGKCGCQQVFTMTCMANK